MPARRDTMVDRGRGDVLMMAVRRLNPCTRVYIYVQNTQCKTSANHASASGGGALIFSSSLAKDN